MRVRRSSVPCFVLSVGCCSFFEHLLPESCGALSIVSGPPKLLVAMHGLVRVSEFPCVRTRVAKPDAAATVPTYSRRAACRCVAGLSRRTGTICHAHSMQHRLASAFECSTVRIFTCGKRRGLRDWPSAHACHVFLHATLHAYCMHLHMNCVQLAAYTYEFCSAPQRTGQSAQSYHDYCSAIEVRYG